MHCGYLDATRKGNHPSFLTPTVVGGRGPLHLKFALKVTQSFKTRRLRQTSADNISTVRYSENSSIMTNRESTSGFPTSYRRSSYVTNKAPKEWIKGDFKNTIMQVQSIRPLRIGELARSPCHSRAAYLCSLTTWANLTICK